MAPKTDRIKVEMTDSSDGETRTFKIILTAPNGDFQLADLLRQRGVISSLDGELKQAVKVATQSYLAGAEGLIKTLAKASMTTLKSRNDRMRKDRSTGPISQSSASASEPKRGSTAGNN